MASTKLCPKGISFALLQRPHATKLVHDGTLHIIRHWSCFFLGGGLAAKKLHHWLQYTFRCTVHTLDVLFSCWSFSFDFPHNDPLNISLPTTFNLEGRNVFLTFILANYRKFLHNLVMTGTPHMSKHRKVGGAWPKLPRVPSQSSNSSIFGVQSSNCDKREDGLFLQMLQHTEAVTAWLWVEYRPSQSDPLAQHRWGSSWSTF